ncbi:Vi polysaccharide biosynthesis UDP-N-acetylglucosamine C-6 dehydrogenase TviB [Luteimonas sp. FXH3W]|uniref:Vi polysaccharide biosynthesis UDP-N-acetylglucosamine C-6 dehydrogenase TviB n=1 Tax=Aquilutibacter rugosus TaxID=3115820 RepID=A0ABU7UWG5_9GAMM
MQQTKIAIIGQGYVGLPLAVEFGKKYPTVGFDINQARIAELREGKDSTLEVEPELLARATQLSFTHELQDIADSTVYIVTVPTPIDSAKRPDLTPLEKASAAIGSVLKKGDTVVYESTVYPGCTEEVCIPILEKTSGLTFNQDFYAGYSPERINPGDKEHRLPSILKVTSGSTPEVADYVDALYSSIITAGTHKAPSIKVAEASKVIENTQRDANIALVNEFAMIFHRLGIDTNDVLEAAGTKWNFLKFKPGLVGGHCIGVDPYYLIQKAQSVGYYPDVLMAARRINDSMDSYVADQVIKLMVRKGINPVQAHVLILGLTFKENCRDLRNTRVVNIVHALQSYNANVDVFDPWVDVAEVQHEYGLTPIEAPEQGAYDAIILAVGHDEFKQLGSRGVRAYGKPAANIVYDVKQVLPRAAIDGRL